MRRDVISAYAASGAKILSWVVVSAIVFRKGGVAEFGILALIRGTIGLLNYVSLGLAPAMVKLLAEEQAKSQIPQAETAAGVISYYNPQRESRLNAIYSNAMSLATICALVGMILIGGYALGFRHVHRVPLMLGRVAVYTTCFMGLGLLWRLISEAPGAILQTTGRIGRDNRMLIEAELLWVAATAALVWGSPLPMKTAVAAALAYLAAGLFLMIRRIVAARSHGGRPVFRMDGQIIGSIVRIGGLVTLAQLADFLYAPTDYILINQLLGTRQVAWYAPAVQIDSALLVLVSGLAAVLFPHSAVAHAAGDVAAVKRYYLWGTLASFLILVVAGGVVWWMAPFLFRVWLGSDMPITREILPLVLIHTVIGGSAMVGRSILLAVGKVKPFAISVLIAGVTNVVLSYVFVRYMGWGLSGIVAGTIVAVVLRCVVWMPWYVMRVLREVKQAPVGGVETPVV